MGSGRGVGVGLVVLVLVLVALGAVHPAAAAQGKGAFEQCFGPGPLTPEEAEMTCTKVGDGEWQPTGGPSDLSSSFGTFLFLGLLLSLVPAFVAVSLAHQANISGAAAFFIGLATSWAGVIGLYLYGHAQERGVVVTAGPAVEARGAPEPAAASSTPAGRLRSLQDLLDQGLITQEEFDARRAATLDNL